MKRETKGNDRTTKHASLMDRVRGRCVEEGDCLLWSGAMCTRGPVITVDRKQLPVRRLAWEERHAVPFPAGKLATIDCEHPNCIVHVVARTWGQLNARTNKRHAGISRGMKVSATKRRTSKLSDEAVADIRQSQETTRIVATRHGISQVYASLIRRNKYRRDFSDPFSGLGAR